MKYRVKHLLLGRYWKELLPNPNMITNLVSKGRAGIFHEDVLLAHFSSMSSIDDLIGYCYGVLEFKEVKEKRNPRSFIYEPIRRSIKIER